MTCDVSRKLYWPTEFKIDGKRQAMVITSHEMCAKCPFKVWQQSQLGHIDKMNNKVSCLKQPVAKIELCE